MKHPSRIPGSRWLLLLLILGQAVMAQAAQITVRTDRNPVPLDESFQIVFDVQGEASGNPDFSVLEKDFRVLGTSRSLRTTFVNGKMQRTNEYLVSAMARRAGRLTIPPVSFGSDTSPAITIQVLPASTAAAAKAGKADVFVEATVDSEAPYVQQQVLLSVRIYHRIQWREASLSEPEFRGGEVLVEKLGEDRNFQATRNGAKWNVIERRYALFPQSSGRIEMDPLVLTLRVPSGERKARNRSPFGDPFFDDFFSRQTYTRKVVRSGGITLQVRPVPASFSGRHWLPARQVKLEESWSAPLDALKTGEPVTRTLTLIADGVSLGQMPELSMPELPGLRIYPDEPQTREEATADGVRSITTRKFAIIPVQAGELRIPEVKLKWWDVNSDSEQVAKLPAHRLTATGAAVVPQPNPPVQPGARATPPSAGQPSQGQAQALPSVSLPVVGQPGAGIERWLLLGNVLFATLWLITLVAWLRARRQGRAEAAGVEEAPAAEKLREQPLWKALHEAAERKDAQKMREALLALAPLLWPQEPPRSLEGMARRVDAPLEEQLNRLSRRLYGDGGEDWDGTVIEAELRKLRRSRKAGPEEGPRALRPLYPTA